MTGAEALERLELGTAVVVTEQRAGEAFTGVIDDVLPPNGGARPTSTFRIRRDTPVVVDGHLRQEYWADASELQPRSHHASAAAAADFEARR